ncbi:MAG: helix-turn-helix transcriptional regulator [Treponema sp.]|nr:helix-turn-helix transcriptional regulator [Treponema sp.]
MEWITALKKAIDFMEANLCNDISADDVAKEVCISSFYLQKGFAIVTGFSLMEYVRNRRLYNAAQDILKNEEKIIDIAYKYCYETPESFTKAFSRFHGITPREVCKNPSSIKTFVPLKITISIKGGFTMDKLEFTTEVLDEFTVIGFEKEFAFDQGYNLIPKYWDEINKISMPVLFYGKKPETDIEKAICENGIGQFGVCIDDLGENRFKYMIAGRYKGCPVP